MRTAKCGSDECRKFERDLEENNGYNKNIIYEICDNNQTDKCLESVDKLLEPHGFEIVILDLGWSDYVFKIDQRRKS